MSELLPPAERAERQDVRRDTVPGRRTVGGIQTLHLWISVLPAVVVALVGAATVTFLLTTDPDAGTARLVLAVAVAVFVLVLFAAAYGASVATRSVHRRLDVLRSVSAQAHDLPEEQVTQAAVRQVTDLTPGGGSDQRVEVFVNLARRMQSLVHREIQLLDDLEAQVEDPDLLKGLFTVDHLATRMRRQSESLAVLGGAVSRRQWSRPVSMQEVLRAAVAEVEHYSRVKVVPPVEGTLHGNAVAAVIHLVAELVENATKFSAPHTQVLLRAQHVTAGLAIDVEDRGLGMPLTDQQRTNELLADPGRIDIDELLHDGRIGLFVVSALARRHGIRVALQTNIYGGVQAVVVLPTGLIDVGTPTGEPQPQAQPAQRAQPASANAPAPTPHPAPSADPAPAPSPTARPAPAPAARPRHAASVAPSVDAPPVDAPGDQKRDLPVRRRPSPRPVSQRETPSPAQPATPAPDHSPASPRPTDHGQRPRLPQRRVQTHLAPQLREPPTSPVRQHDDPAADHTPGLMAAFQGGISRADEEDGPVDRAERTP